MNINKGYGQASGHSDVGKVTALAEERKAELVQHNLPHQDAAEGERAGEVSEVQVR